MTTIIDTIIPTESVLSSILSEIVNSNVEETNYVINALENVVNLLNKDGKTYISYGPWWPAIKNLIIENGNTNLGQVVESDVAQIYSYSRPALTILAGIMYSASRLNDHVVTDPYHYLDVSQSADDTEPYLYVSTDESIDKYQFPH